MSGGHPKGLIVSVLHEDKGRPEVFEATCFALRDPKVKDEENTLGVKSCPWIKKRLGFYDPIPATREIPAVKL